MEISLGGKPDRHQRSIQDLQHCRAKVVSLGTEGRKPSRCLSIDVEFRQLVNRGHLPCSIVPTISSLLFRCDSAETVPSAYKTEECCWWCMENKGPFGLRKMKIDTIFAICSFPVRTGTDDAPPEFRVIRIWKVASGVWLR